MYDNCLFLLLISKFFGTAAEYLLQKYTSFVFGTATFLYLIVLWVGLSVPLTFLGAWRGFVRPVSSFVCLFVCETYIQIVHNQPPTNQPTNQQPIAFPVPANPLPREHPAVSPLATLFAVAAGGILPFAIAFIELYLVLSSVWQNQYFYAFYVLSAVWAVSVVATAQMSVVLCYFQLCQQVCVSSHLSYS